LPAKKHAISTMQRILLCMWKLLNMCPRFTHYHRWGARPSTHT